MNTIYQHFRGVEVAVITEVMCEERFAILSRWTRFYRSLRPAPATRSMASEGSARFAGTAPNCRTSVVEAAGVELFHCSENIQVIDSTKRQKRWKRYSRRFEVHDGYTDREIESRGGAR